MAVKELQKYKQDNNDGVQILIFNEKAQLCSNKDYAESISVVLNPIKEKMLTKVVLEVCGIILKPGQLCCTDLRKYFADEGRTGTADYSGRR